MSLRSQPLPPVPEDTARIAQAAFRRGTPYMLLRDRFGGDCQEFRVRAAIVDPKEVPDGTTQSTPYS